MLTLLEQITQKLPQAPESVLQEVWVILNSLENESNRLTTKLDENLGEFTDEFKRWEMASELDCAQWEALAIQETK